jgi:DNA (cytosine-5)-methyltransferase 1
MGERMRYISLFSGVEACSVAWHHMDNWIPKVFAEFDAFPSAVLKHQFPHVPNVGDVTKHEWKQYKGQIELIVGGSPCQSFSVAGKRLGLDDPRGNLALHYLRIINDIKPTWFIFENVPGILSSDDGRDFAAFLREVENIGYGCAYRVLDAQHFGVPQRRRRLFVVGHIDGDWRRAAAVLFEPESLSGDNPPSRKKRQEAPTNAGSSTSSSGEYWNGRGITNTLTAKGDDGRMSDKGRFHGAIVPDVVGTLDTDMNQKLTHQSAVAGHLLPVGVDLFNQEETGEIHVPLRTAQGHGAPAVMTFDARGNGEGDVTNTLVGDHQSRVTDFTALAVQPVDGENVCFDHTFGQNYGLYDNVSPTLKVNGAVPTSPAVTQTPFHQAKNPASAEDDTRWEQTTTQPTLNTWVGHNETKIQTAVTTALAVRRLIPVECERLQGFPDNWTRIPWKNKPVERCPDGPRFKAMGNSMAVPVMRWIGEGIELVNRIPRTKAPQQEELGWL